jgi:hypothetical protein
MGADEEWGISEACSQWASLVQETSTVYAGKKSKVFRQVLSPSTKKAKEMSIAILISTSKNIMSFLLLLMSTLHKIGQKGRTGSA